MLKKIITGLIIIMLLIVVVFLMIKADIINISWWEADDNEPVSNASLSPFLLQEKTNEQYGEATIEKSNIFELLDDELEISDNDFKTAFNYYRNYNKIAWMYVEMALGAETYNAYLGYYNSLTTAMGQLNDRIDTMGYRLSLTTATDDVYMSVLYNTCTTDYSNLLFAQAYVNQHREKFIDGANHVIVDNIEHINIVSGLKDALVDYTEEYYVVLNKIQNNTVTDEDMNNLLNKYNIIIACAVTGIESSSNDRSLEYYTNLSDTIENTYSSIKNLYDNKNLLDATVTQKAEQATDDIKNTVETNKQIAESGSQDITQEFETVLGDMEDVSNNPINTIISSNGFIIKMIVIFLAEILVGVVLCRV